MKQTLTRHLAGLTLLALLWPASLGGQTLPARPGNWTTEESNTVEIFRRVSRGVVHIEVRKTAESQFKKSISDSQTGTGFIYDRAGRILTAYHVIQGNNQIDVILSNGRRLRARLVGTAPQLDLALLQVSAPADELFPLTLGDSRALEVGQKVLAIGNPVGLHNTLTVGIVSALRRSLDNASVELQDAMIQTDAAINPGSSGGPLLDSNGRVIGINTATVEGAQNVGFAIPIHLARRVTPDLIKMGHPYRPRLGFSGSEITPALVILFGLPLDQGFLVEEVLPGSPAHYAGLQAGERIVIVNDKTHVLGGDIITAINEESLTHTSQIARTLLESHPGQTLRLKVYRKGKTIELTIPLRRMQMLF